MVAGGKGVGGVGGGGEGCNKKVLMCSLLLKLKRFKQVCI